MNTRRRFWLLYMAGWIPYLGLFSSVFFVSGEMPAGPSLVAGVHNALPAAVFGLGVVWVCSHVSWREGTPARFFSIHALAAAVYATVVGFTSGALFFLTWPLFAPHLPQESSGMAMMVWQFFMGLMVYTILASVTYAVRTAARLREEEHRATQAESLRTQAELQALRTQLNPHFLFNTLHSLIALVRSDSDAAEEGIEQFADLLRYASRVHQETRDEVTLSEEWQFVQNYLALESLRIGDRLHVHAELEENTLECIVPAFCLQPLVENAIRHGIAPRAHGGSMWIRGHLVNGSLQLEVTDDGPGADPHRVFNNGRMGLRLVRQRLEALYGDQAQFDIVTSNDRGFTVRLALPTRRGSSHD